MIHFKVYGPLPRSMLSNKCHFISTRNSLFGVHRYLQRIDFDNSCTKTTLVGFLEEDQANTFLQRLDFMQRSGIDINRCNTLDNVLNFDKFSPYGNSMAPLQLEGMTISDIERLCLLHFFDMYIVANMDHDISNDNITLMCYENKTYEWPNRDILDRFMRDMYRNDI